MPSQNTTVGAASFSEEAELRAGVQESAGFVRKNSRVPSLAVTDEWTSSGGMLGAGPRVELGGKMLLGGAADGAGGRLLGVVVVSTLDVIDARE
ncbi:MAG: hypothetical protein ABI421_17145, partial [Polyangiaceae bacterium]